MDAPKAQQLTQGITALRPRQIGALPLLYPILDHLQVRQITNALVPSQAEIDLGRIVLLLTLNRLLAPKPLYQVQEWLGQTVLPQLLELAPEKLYDNRLGRALGRLYSHLGELWARLLCQAIKCFALDLKVLHWDITSIYFEGAYTQSELLAYGYSRDHRPDTKQVNLQVDVSHDGYVPVSYQLLRGNTADITRPLPHLSALGHFLARPELAQYRVSPILVSDCKLITPEAVLAYHQQGLFYLGPLPNGPATEALLGSVVAEELAAHPLAYRPQRIKPDAPNFVPYQGMWRQFTFEHGGQKVTDRALVVCSEGKHHLDEQKRKTYLKRLLKGLAAIQKKLNTRRYKQRAYVQQRLDALKQGNPAKALVDTQLSGADGELELHFRINRQRLAEAQVLSGRYGLVTNAKHLDAEQALGLFKGQDGVEKRFGAVKGPLLVHPLFVRTDRRIEGLI